MAGWPGSVNVGEISLMSERGGSGNLEPVPIPVKIVYRSRMSFGERWETTGCSTRTRTISPPCGSEQMASRRCPKDAGDLRLTVAEQVTGLGLLSWFGTGKTPLGHFPECPRGCSHQGSKTPWIDLAVASHAVGHFISGGQQGLVFDRPDNPFPPRSKGAVTSSSSRYVELLLHVCLPPMFARIV